jgi:LPS export ABC transporter protein LptC
MGKLTGRKALGAIFAVSLLAAAVVWYAGQDRAGRPSVRDIPLTFSLENITMVQGQNGTRSWRLEAEKSDYFKNKSVITLKRPRFTYYMQDKRSDVLVTAERGRFDTSSEQGRFGPGVRAEFQDIVLEAQRMTYREKGKTFVFSDRVRVRKPDMNIRSDKARVDLAQETVTCWGQVEVDVHGQDRM